MRERLRLYIYPTDFHCDQRRPKNTNRGYMAEWNFYDRARKSSLRVQDPENASIYYIPTFTSCWRSQGRSRGEGGQQAGKRMQQMLKDVASNFPFFQRNHGQRHIWVSAHDMGKAEPLLVGCKQNTGPSLCSDAALSLTEMLAKNSSALVNTADDAEHTKLESFAAYGFNRHLDVPLVCNGDTSFASRGARVPLTGRPRKNSVFFAGRWDQNYVPVRFIAIRIIMEAKLHKPTSFNKKIGPQAYERSLAESDLCLAPRGSRVWSPRLFEMIWFGCIPVIIASGYHLPASCFFDWREFSIFIEDKDAHKAGQILKTYLDDPKRLEQMRRKVFRIRKTFMWHDEDSLACADVKRATGLLASWGKALRWKDVLAGLKELVKTPSAAFSLPKAGIEASVVLLNAVSSACEKACAQDEALTRPWPLALALLSLASSWPDTVAYSTAISTCEKAVWEQALEVLWAMRCSSVRMNTYAFNAAISACASGYHWEGAFCLWDEMQAMHGLKPDLITYSALISACAEGLKWRHTLALLSEAWQGSEQVIFSLFWAGGDCGLRALRRAGLGGPRLTGLVNPRVADRVAHIVRWTRNGQRNMEEEAAQPKKIQPDLILCNTVISACEKGHQWEKALCVLAALLLRGPRPDAISYSAAMSACCAASAWQWALWLQKESDTGHFGSLPATSVLVSALCAQRNWQVALSSLVSPCSDASHGMDAGAWASVAAAAVGRARLQIMEDAEIRVEAEAGLTPRYAYPAILSSKPGAGRRFAASVEETPLEKLRNVAIIAHVDHGPDPLVVINKVDRPMVREKGEVENEIFDVFATMATSDEQMEYPTLYASGKAGFCASSLEEAQSDGRPTDMKILYETIRDVVPSPEPASVDPDILALDEKNKGFSMLVSQLDRLPALGPTVTGKIFSGQIHKGDKIHCKSLQGEVVASGKVKEITVVLGVTREPVKSAKVRRRRRRREVREGAGR
eukprot:g13679.t1